MHSRLSYLTFLGFVGLSAASAVNWAQADIRVFAAGGYGSLSQKDDKETKKPSGFDAKLSTSFDIFSPVPGFSIYAGPDLLLGTYAREISAVKQTTSRTGLGLQAGVHLGMIPVVSLQVEGNYSTAVAGEAKREDLVISVTSKMKSGSEMGATLRALITPFPLLRAGVEYSFGSGNAKYESATEEVKYDYSAIRAVVGIAL